MQRVNRAGVIVAFVAASAWSAPAPAADDRAPAPAPARTASSVDRFVRAADYSAKFHGDAVLVMDPSGKILYERYERGWNSARPHFLASGTKSFTGVAAMIAVGEGIISLDERVSDTLTEWKTDPRKSRITVRELLNLSSGLEANPGALPPRGGAFPPRRRSADFFKSATGVDAVADPGKRFEYGSAHYFAFGAFFERKLQNTKNPCRTLLEYYDAKLLKPIGLDASLFAVDKAGHPDLPGGGRLTARDWAKFGLLVLHDGRTSADPKSRQVIAPDKLKECLTPSATNPAYGLTWWLLTPPGARFEGQGLLSRKLSESFRAPIRADGKPVRGHIAAGAGGQLLCVLPDEGLIIVRFSRDLRVDPGGFSITEFLRLALDLPDRSTKTTPAGTREGSKIPNAGD